MSHGSDGLLYDALETIFRCIDKIPLTKSYFGCHRTRNPKRGLEIRRTIQHWRKQHGVLDSSRAAASMPFDLDRVDRLVNIAMDRGMVHDLVKPLASLHGLRRAAYEPRDVYMCQDQNSSCSIMTWIVLYTKPETVARMLKHMNQHSSWLVYAFAQQIASFLRPSPVPYVWNYEDNHEGKNRDWFREWEDHMRCPLVMTAVQRQNVYMLCASEWQHASKDETVSMQQHCSPNRKWWPEMGHTIASFADVGLVDAFFDDECVVLCLERHRRSIPDTMRLLLHQYQAGEVPEDTTLAVMNKLSHILRDSGQLMELCMPRLDMRVVSVYNRAGLSPDKFGMTKFFRVLHPMLDISTTQSLKDTLKGSILRVHHPKVHTYLYNELCWRQVCRNGALLPRIAEILSVLATCLHTTDLIIPIVLLDAKLDLSLHRSMRAKFAALVSKFFQAERQREV